MKKVLFVALFAMLLSGCNNHPQEKIIYSVLDKECPTFEKKFPAKTVEVSCEFAKDDSSWVIRYSSFEEAEWKMFHFYSPEGIPESRFGAEFDYDLFQQVILSDTSSMSYPFDSIVKYANITIADSDDGLVRIYTWERPHNHTMSSFETITQYRWKGKVKIQNPPEPEFEGDFPSEAEAVYTVRSNSKTYYLVSYYFKSCSNYASKSLNAFLLTKKGLMPVALFDTEYGPADNISFDYSIPDWYFRANLGEGYDWLGYYDRKNRVYYSCNSEFYLSDRYIRYVFDGNRFVMQEESAANPFLSPLLHDYVFLEILLETKRNKIRIDLMEDETYRYAAWKANDRMLDEPEIVILGGSFDELSSSYVFMNNGCEYRVNDTSVSVLKEGKTIANWEVYNRWLDE